MATGDPQLRIPFATLLKIAFTVLLIVVIVRLWAVILMLIVAVLVAVMLDPVVVWLEGHRVRRGLGITAIAVVIFSLLILFFTLLMPAMSRQIAEVSKQLPQMLQRLASTFPSIVPLLRTAGGGPGAITRDWLVRGLIAGKFAIAGLSAVIFVLVIAIYLLVEGRLAYDWLVSFAPARNRSRFDRTGREIREVVLAFMRGLLINSTICSVFVFVVLTALGIPVPLLLATLAFVADFVPVIGTIVMIIPAALLALVVSPLRAVVVVAAYLFYHLMETYVIIPRVYGTQMRLSTLTVLVAIAIGGTLQGVIGAVLALPIAAAYPIVERIWLREHLPADTVKRHEAIEEG